MTTTTRTTVVDLVDASAAAFPDRPAIVAADGSFTYAQLRERSDALARRLQSQGVARESTVGICLPRSARAVTAIVGVLKAGGAYVPVEPDDPAERLGYIVADAGLRAVITDAARVNDPVFGATSAVLSYDHAIRPLAAPAQRTAPPGPPDLAYVMYTSGSSGRPKGVQVTHANLSWSIQARLHYYPPALHALVFPSSFAFDASAAAIFWTLCRGGCLVLPEPGMEKDPAALAALVAGYHASHLLCVASLYDCLLQTCDRGLLRSLDVVVIGGEPCPPALVGRHVDQMPRARLFNEYGPTEATVWASVHEVTPDDRHGPVPIGRAAPGARLLVLDERRKAVPPGTAGEIAIGGNGVARGYLNQPGLTAARFLPDALSRVPGGRLYLTGDRGRVRQDGALEFLGRTDDQVNLNGFRIELGEVEAVLNEHPDVERAVVQVREQSAGNSRLVAYIAPRRGHAASAHDFRAYLRTRVPRHMVPAVFMLLEAMPLTAGGKIDRQALPAPDLPARAGAAGDQHGLESMLEHQIVQIFERVLGVRPVGVSDDFFELGGSSLLAPHLCIEIEQLTGKRLPLATLLQAPTPGRLAGRLLERGWRPPWSSLVPLQTTGHQPALFCVHGEGGNVLTYRELARRLPQQPLYGLQSVGLDGQETPYTRLEAMAEHYVREIRALQPEGPYHVGGYSLGGLVAFEMARQLAAAGCQVGLVALFDTFAPPRSQGSPRSAVLKQRAASLADRVHGHASVLLRGPNRLAYLRASSRTIRRRIRSRLWQVAYWTYERRRPELPEALRNVTEANLLAARRYAPGYFDGRVTLFAARRSAGESMDRAAAWGAVARDVAIYNVHGDHLSLLSPPHVDVLARYLADALKTSAADAVAPRLHTGSRHGASVPGAAALEV